MINAFYKNSTWQKKVHSFWCSRVQPSEWGFTSPEGSRGNYLLFFSSTSHVLYFLTDSVAYCTKVLLFFVRKKRFDDASVGKKSQDLSSCFQRAVAYLFPSGLFDKQARPMMKVWFLVTFLNNCSMIFWVTFSFCWYLFIYLQHPNEVFPEQRSKCS